MRWFLLILCLATPALAQQREVDLELVLMADASGSIDAGEIALQRQGYAQAITDPAVISAIRGGMLGQIAVVYVEWAANQAVVVDWTIIDSAETAQGFADALLIPPRQAVGRNAIGAALLVGQQLIASNDFTGIRRVIDFSGDSIGNFSGPTIEAARISVLDAGIVINGLPIVRRNNSDELESAYRNRIIGGPGAFVVVADTGDRFAEAVRRKLVLEIAGLTPQTQMASAGSSPDNSPRPAVLPE